MRCSMRCPILRLALLLPLACGCELLQTVELASRDERLPSPAFVVSPPEDEGPRPRYHTVRVVDEDGRTVWHLRARPFSEENAASRLVYGEPLARFDEVVPATPLEVGGSYQLSVHGRRLGTTRFLVVEDGSVRAAR